MIFFIMDVFIRSPRQGVSPLRAHHVPSPLLVVPMCPYSYSPPTCAFLDSGVRRSSFPSEPFRFPAASPCWHFRRFAASLHLRLQHHPAGGSGRPSDRLLRSVAYLMPEAAYTAGPLPPRHRLRRQSTALTSLDDGSEGDRLWRWA